MSARFVRELHQILDVLQYPVTRTEQIKDVRVLILRGEGAAFCAGYDLKDSTMSKANTPFLQNAFSGLIKKLRETLREFLEKKTYIFGCFWAFPFIFFTSLYLSGDFMWRWAYLKRPSVRRGIIFSWVRFVQLHCKNSWFVTFVCLTRKDTTTCGLRCERCCCRCWNESRLGSRFAYRVHQEVAFLGILCEAWPRRRGSHKFAKNICFAKATTVHPRCLNWWV